jgi:hypothetical protein
MPQHLNIPRSAPVGTITAGQHLNLKPVAPTCGKRRYWTLEEARTQRDRLAQQERARGSATAGELVVYKCETCGGCFHVGHRTQ